MNATATARREATCMCVFAYIRMCVCVCVHKISFIRSLRYVPSSSFRQWIYCRPVFAAAAADILYSRVPHRVVFANECHCKFVTTIKRQRQSRKTGRLPTKILSMKQCSIKETMFVFDSLNTDFFGATTMTMA